MNTQDRTHPGIPNHGLAGRLGGIRFLGDANAARRAIYVRLEELKMHRWITTDFSEDGRSVSISLLPEFAQDWVPRGDTLNLCKALDLDPGTHPLDFEREVLISMLASPLPLTFRSHLEFAASVRIRRNIAEAARRTQLSFHTSEAERPADFWTYKSGSGFTLLPGKPIVEALEKATQPEASGKMYSFSCYRATEYVILLGLAKELALTNPPLLAALQSQWERQAIMSRNFHDTFLHEHGSMENPLPPRHFIPGDRLWLRNPDTHSSDVSGYEGSWTFYLGGGLFSNFWDRNCPRTLEERCIEIFHWRHGVYLDDAGEPRIDESIVSARIQETNKNPEEMKGILKKMMRLRDPQGVYADGGCLDASREFPRGVCPGTADIVLP
jgi:hypothetical protein